MRGARGLLCSLNRSVGARSGDALSPIQQVIDAIMCGRHLVEHRPEGRPGSQNYGPSQAFNTSCALANYWRGIRLSEVRT